jgi:uncharacterized protein (TIGR03437 family)
MGVTVNGAFLVRLEAGVGGLTFGTNPITGNGDVTFVNFSSADALKLNVANTYTGQTIIGPSGEILANVNGAIPTTSDLVVNSGGILKFAQNSTVASLGGPGTVNLPGTTLSCDGNPNGIPFSGTLAGTGGLTKTGTGTLVLNGANTTTGTLTVSSGTVTLLGNWSGNVLVGPGATFTVAGGSVGGTITRAPSITSSFTATGTYGNNTFGYAITAANAPTTFGLTGTLPSGLTFTAGTGVISGTPTQTGTFNLLMSAGNAAGTDTEPLAITINKAPLTVSANPQSITYGQAKPTFTAGVSGFVNGDNASAVSGSPSLSDNSTLTNGKPNAGSWTITPIVGTLTATNYTFSTFNTAAFTVSKVALTVSADPLTVAYGGAPPFTASISGFVNGDSSAVVSGAAGFSTNATLTSGKPNAGSWTITPSAGTLSAASYTFGTFNTGTLTVNKAVLTVTANNLSKVFGAALPTLAVSFSGFVNGDTTAAATGSASLTTTANASSPVGNYTINAATGTLAAVNYTFTLVNGALSVTKANTTISLTFSGLTLNAVVTAVPPGAGTPTGTVQIASGASAPTTVALNNGMASVAVAPGTLTVTYFGDSNFNGSSSFTATAVPPASSSISVTSSANPSLPGQAVTFTARVSVSGGPAFAEPPTGNVQFFDGPKLLATVNLSGGSASFTTSSLSAGPHSIVGSYSGDSTYPGDQGIVVQVVNVPVNLTASVSPAAPVFGQTAVLTVNVTSGVTGFGSPTGRVTWFDSTASGGSSVSSGTATFNLTPLAPGTYTVTLQFVGDTPWTSTTQSVTFTVAQASTNTTISLTTGSGQPTLTANVVAIAPGAGTPTGSVQFIDTSTNAVVAGAALSSGKGSATIGLSNVGRPIKAVYSGDPEFLGGASASLPAVVNGASDALTNLAPDEVATLFGIPGLSGDTSATSTPADSLGGVTVTITDSAGNARKALLYGVFASVGQINLLIPGATATGLATMTITLPGGTTIVTLIDIASAAPGIFTADMTGKGVFAGQILYVHKDGSQTVANSTNPVSFTTPDDQVFLILYGTGFRHAGAVTVTANGVALQVVYSGPQGTYPGLDQLNLLLPRSFAGGGSLTLAISADGQPANSVTVAVQ